MLKHSPAVYSALTSQWPGEWCEVQAIAHFATGSWSSDYSLALKDSGCCGAWVAMAPTLGSASRSSDP